MINISDYNIKLLKIQDETLTITKMEVIDREQKDGQTLLAYVERTKRNTICCKYCGCTELVIKQYYNRRVNHIPGAFKECIIILTVTRYKCKACKRTFNESFDFVDDNAVESKLLKIEMFERSKEETFTKISKDLNVSTARVYKEFELNMDISRLKLQEVLCIDEVAVKTEVETYVLILYDPINKKIIDVLPNRHSLYLEDYLSKIPYEERRVVKYFITDLFSAYKNRFKNYFPSAVHVVDTFHWVKLATAAMNSIRINIMNNYKRLCQNKALAKEKGYEKFYKMLKNNGRLLLINPANKPLIFFDQKLKKNPYDVDFTLQEAIEFMINQDEDLCNAYFTLQQLYSISVTSTYSTIKERLGEWIRGVLSEKEKSVGSFKEVANTYKLWFNEIQNSFIIYDKTYKRLSNGNIEGVNREIQLIKDKSAGVEKYKVIRAKIMYHFNNK